MAPPIVFDLLRLFLGPTTPTPRGIDRVDLAYARYLFSSWPGDCVGVLPTPVGMKLYDRRRVLQGLDMLEVLWREGSPRPDTALANVERRIRGKAGAPSDPRHPMIRRLRSVPRLARLLLATGLPNGGSAVAAAPDEAIYLNVGQLGWAVPWLVSWMRHRPDVRPVFMLHDAIPVERPDLVTPIGCTAHRRMLSTAARHAAGLIFTTQAATASILQVLESHGQPVPRTISLHLPVAPSFLASPEPEPEPGPDPGPALADHAYFVVVGAIEQRKNLLMLLNVWSRLRRLRSARTPRLVIAGSPGRGGRPILRQLQISGAADDVIVASGLPSPALRRLVANARAVLMPSWAEGFGLPIIEALAVGTPVLASDLASHREVGGELAVYLDPDDEAGWLREICRFADGDTTTAALRGRVGAYQGTTPAQYFSRIAGFLEELR
jgi:glycosyltransferase involved in cell wall biosynthesis